MRQFLKQLELVQKYPQVQKDLWARGIAARSALKPSPSPRLRFLSFQASASLSEGHNPHTNPIYLPSAGTPKQAISPNPAPAIGFSLWSPDLFEPMRGDRINTSAFCASNKPLCLPFGC